MLNFSLKPSLQNALQGGFKQHVNNTLEKMITHILILDPNELKRI